MEKNNETKKRANQFLKGTLILTGAGLVVKVIGSLNWIILSRVLGGEGIGLYQMAFPLYLLALSVSSAGIPIAISIITAEKVALQDYRGANRVFKLSLAFLTITGLFFALLLFFGASWLIEHRFIRDPRAYYSLIALSPAIFFVTILSSFRGYLQGWQIMTPTAVSQIVEQLFRVAAMLFFASLFLSKGLEYAAGGASLGAGAGAVAGLLVLIYYYWKLRTDLKKKQQPGCEVAKQESNLSIIRRVVILALPVSLSSLMLPVVSNLDLLIVPARLEVAGYTVEQATELFGYLTGMAVPLVNLATILTAALATSLVPAISEACALGSAKQVYQKIASAMRMANLVTIPGFVLLWLLATPISTMIYNAPQASESIRILSVAIFLLGIHQVSTGVLQGMGHTTIPVVNMGISAGAKVVLNWLLTAIPALGIMGAAWATVADIGVAAMLNMYFVHRYTGFYIESKGLLKNSLAAAVMGVVIYFTYDVMILLAHNNTLATMITALAGMISYSLILLVTGGIQEQDISRLPMIGPLLIKVGRIFGVFRNK